ncbi:putative glucooligosaccharide oxidase [Phyllosticta citrichinensis]
MWLSPFLPFLLYLVVGAAAVAVDVELVLRAEDEDLGRCWNDAVGGDKDRAQFPDEALYQLRDVKPLNLDISVTPAAVTYPKTTEEVAEVVRCAVKYRRKVQARSGGHSYANHCLGGAGSTAVVVDLEHFQRFEIDRASWIATMGAGTLLENSEKRLHENGNRIISQGVAPQVGLGGHASIGGLGPLDDNLVPAAADQVVEVEVVLANSTVLRATKDENKDVFFAVLGAGASFAIITEYKFQTSPEPGEMSATFKAWNKLVSDPDLSWKFASTLTILDRTVSINGIYFGPRSEFDSLNIEAQLPGGPKLELFIMDDVIGKIGQTLEDVGLHLSGSQASFYAKSLAFTPSTLMNDKAIDALFEYLEKSWKDALLWFVIFDLSGGYINTVPLDERAYPHRNGLYFMQSYAITPGRVGQTTRDFLNGINRLIVDNVPGVGGAYAGHVDPFLENAQQVYWGPTLGRLEKIKRRHQINLHVPESGQIRAEQIGKVQG